MPNRRTGFTLIELLVVVAIIGILVTVSLANFMYALERARQRRTMADMRGIASALDAYGIDHNVYPPSAATVLPPGLALPTDTVGTAMSHLSPTYLRTVPLVDGWHSWFEYGTTGGGALAVDFVIRSCGKDGLPEASPPFGPTTSFNSDIIFVDGSFVQYPLVR